MYENPDNNEPNIEIMKKLISVINRIDERYRKQDMEAAIHYICCHRVRWRSVNKNSKLVRVSKVSILVKKHTHHPWNTDIKNALIANPAYQTLKKRWNEKTVIQLIKSKWAFTELKKFGHRLTNDTLTAILKNKPDLKEIIQTFIYLYPTQAKALFRHKTLQTKTSLQEA